jgi:hypothetical protein
MYRPKQRFTQQWNFAYFLFGGSTNQMIFLFQFLPLPMMIVLFGSETFGDGSVSKWTFFFFE